MGAAETARKEGKATVRIEFRMNHLSSASRKKAKRVNGITGLGLYRSISVIDAHEAEVLNAAIEATMKKISAKRAAAERKAQRVTSPRTTKAP